MRGTRLVVALGGNAIAPDGRAGSAADQTRAIANAMVPLADLIAAGSELVLAHGNGPQVGDQLIRNELARDVLPSLPLDWCVAHTQATIGSVAATALGHELAARGAARPVAPVITRVLVDADDPAWQRPTKPVGPYVSAFDAHERMAAGEEVFAPQGGLGWRRLVPSPAPLQVLDLDVVVALLRAGATVVAGGGGGIPMVSGPDGRLRGVEAVVDKDLTALLLALTLDAEGFVILTDVRGVALNYGTPEERWLDRTSADELRALQRAGQFPEGSMGPKVEAACRFVERTGRWAALGDLKEAAAVVSGTAGTRVLP